MIHNFFQKRRPISSGFKRKMSFLFRCFFYTSLVGFISGFTFGFLHVKGWISTAEKGLILYGVTFGVGAILSTCFVLYQVRQNQLKMEKIRK